MAGLVPATHEHLAVRSVWVARTSRAMTDVWMLQRLLCDEMLRRTGRWLRAAGHDTAISEGAEPDRALIDRARAEARTLVTRDRHLAAEAKAAGIPTILLTDDRVDDQALALARAGVDWLAAPFTRCVIHNTPLVDAPPEVIAALPAGTAGLPGPFRLCPACARPYWPGSHVRRMREKLERWASPSPLAGEGPGEAGG